jgi:hypothetical protein
MTFRAEPAALRDYARKVGDVERVAVEANRYVAAHGSFSMHEAGLMGYAAPGHRQLVAELHKLLGHLKSLGTESRNGLQVAAEGYERTDLRSAAEIDATLPAVPRGLEFSD